MNKLPRMGLLLSPIASKTKFVLMVAAAVSLAASVIQAQTGVTKEQPQASRDASIREQLIGSWRLVSRQSRRINGELEADPGLSVTPLGVLIYDQSGHVAAQLSRRDRTVEMIGEECPAAVVTKGNSRHCADNPWIRCLFRNLHDQRARWHSHSPSGSCSLARRHRQRHQPFFHSFW